MKRRVGAILVSKDHTIIATGYVYRPQILTYYLTNESTATMERLVACRTAIKADASGAMKVVHHQQRASRSASASTLRKMHSLKLVEKELPGKVRSCIAIRMLFCISEHTRRSDFAFNVAVPASSVL